MNQAFNNVFGCDIEVQDEVHLELVNTAWELAKQYEFIL